MIQRLRFLPFGSASVEDYSNRTVDRFSQRSIELLKCSSWPVQESSNFEPEKPAVVEYSPDLIVEAIFVADFVELEERWELATRNCPAKLAYQRKIVESPPGICGF